MRKDWEYKKWADVLTIINGKNQKAVESIDGTYPIYGSGGIMGYANDWLCPENCTIIGRKGNINKPIFVESKFWNVDTAFGLNSNQNLLASKYLYYFCLNYDFNRHNKAVTIPSLTKVDLLKIEMPLPPKPTQLAIVAELDKINELIQLKKQQLKDYDQLAQSIFYEMFGDPVENEKGWEVKKLREIALEKMSYGSGASAVPYNQKIRYIRITDIDELGCLKKDIVSPNICEDKYLLSDGDILFARSGATVGKTFLFKSTYGSCIYAGYLIRLRPNTQIVIPEYVYHYTKTHYYRSFIESNQRVVAQPNINAQQYSSLKLPLPPLPLQQQFAARIEAIERQKQQVSETIKDLETLLASRMQYWFD